MSSRAVITFLNNVQIRVGPIENIEIRKPSTHQFPTFSHNILVAKKPELALSYPLGTLIS